MDRLQLLFTKDGLQYQLLRNKKVLEEHTFFRDEEAPATMLEHKLNEILKQKQFGEITVISALNHFTMMPEGFDQHEIGYRLIGYNASVDREKEELMLSINRKYQVQFYYAFPKVLYQAVKSQNKPVTFNFSGEIFLSKIQPKAQKEIHINLYLRQCEFLALEDRKVVLYNNLDVSSEVDFLYFIMFTISKIGFGTQETRFFVYGETTENETFISEIRKFVRHLKIVFDNIPEHSFILTH